MHTYALYTQTTLQETRSRLQIQSDSHVDNEHKPLIHSSASNSGSIKGSMKKSGIAVRQRRHVHFSEANTKQDLQKGSQLPHKDCDVRCCNANSMRIYLASCMRSSPTANCISILHAEYLIVGAVGALALYFTAFH